MSGSIHTVAMFPSRKRRSGDIVDSLKQQEQESKRVVTAQGPKKNREEGSGSSPPASVATLPSLGVIAGALAPKSKNSHVQEAIHNEVQYSRQGAGKDKVPGNTMAVFRFVQEAFVIPTDIDKDHKFGPLSGVSHEMRVVSAYMAGQLEARSEEGKRGVKMCLECGKKGHFPRHCPFKLLQ